MPKLSDPCHPREYKPRSRGRAILPLARMRHCLCLDGSSILLTPAKLVPFV